MLSHYPNEPTNVPRSEIARRQEKIQKELQKSGIDALLAVQPADLYYMTGLSLNGFFYLPAQEQGREPSRGQGLLALENQIDPLEEASDLYQTQQIEKPEQIYVDWSAALLNEEYGEIGPESDLLRLSEHPHSTTTNA
jgi:Xaa-Pro aminopeptidase